MGIRGTGNRKKIASIGGKNRKGLGKKASMMIKIIKNQEKKAANVCTPTDDESDFDE